MRKESALILSQECLAEDIYSMWIQTELAKESMPGQFISVFTKDGSKLLPRPISLCEIETDKLRIVYRVTGEDTGTKQFARMRAGEILSIMGPLGNGFPLTVEPEGKALLIGGGIGIPPMLELAKQLEKEKKLVMGYGSEQFLTQELQEQGPLYISTEDGSTGTKGNVLDVLQEYQLQADVIYACGPTPMLRAIKQYAEEKKIACYLSLEEKMACGIGACLACVCQSTEKDEHSNVKNKRICKEGPVFLATEVEI